MLVGIDVIRYGDFAVTNYGGKTVFTFRIPSRGAMDFTKHSYLLPAEAKARIGRNDPCPCGSGKKYKSCGCRFSQA